MWKRKTVLMLNWIIWNYVKPFNSVQKKKNTSTGFFKNVIFEICLEIIYFMYV